MNTNTHPDTDALKAYLHDSKSPDFTTLRLHLAQCPSCRDEADVLSSLINNPACLEDTPDGDEMLSNEQHQLIIDYIDGKLQTEESMKAKAIIDSNKYAMKSALHYVSHHSAMANSLPAQTQSTAPATADDEKNNGTSLLSQILSHAMRWFDARPPVWVTVPATAFAVAIVIFSIQPFDSSLTSDKDSDFVVASYQDNAVIQFRSADALPGIGFFSKANSLSKEYKGVLVSIMNDGNSTSGKIKLQWPRINNAIQYSMRLQVFNQGEKVTLGEISTRASIATFDINEISHNKRYEWILTGKTNDEKTFYSTGGFVISNAQ